MLQRRTSSSTEIVTGILTFVITREIKVVVHAVQSPEEVGSVCGCVRNSVYVRLYHDVMAPRRANGGARRCRVLERIWSPFKVSTDATTAVFEEPRWLGTDFQHLEN